MIKPSDITARALELLKDKPQLSPQAIAVIQAVTEAFNAELAKRTTSRHPTLDAVKLAADKIGMKPDEAEKFFNFYACKGWKVGKSPMVSMPHALANWHRKNWEENAAPVKHGPTLAEVKEYAQAKFPLLDLGKFTVDYYGYRSGQKWLTKSGSRLEWQTDFSGQVNKKFSAPRI